MIARSIATVAALLALSPGPAAAAFITWSSADGGNDHSYELVLAPLTWSQARNAAAVMTAGGANRYLATITSQAENDFLFSQFGAATGASSSAWIGASDSAAEGVWRWVEGPEAGTQFWQGGVHPTGAPTLSAYANWGSSEPNNHPTGDPAGEDFGVFALTRLGPIAPGQWADTDNVGTNASVVGYLVEYDAAVVTVPAPPGLVLAVAGLLSMMGYWCRRGKLGAGADARA